jgi:hypothetical protein
MIAVWMRLNSPVSAAVPLKRVALLAVLEGDNVYCR